MYGRNHGTGDWQGGWNPPEDYLAEEEARIQAVEREWQQREEEAAQQQA